MAARLDGMPRSAAVAWRVLRCDPLSYLWSWLGWVVFLSVPIPVGLLLKWVLDHVAADPAGGPSVLMVLVVLGAVETARWLELLLMVVQWHGAWVGWHTVPRLNIMRSLAVDPGPAARKLPSSPGEAVSRFRDDCQDLSLVLDVWLDMSGIAVASTLALVIMATIDASTTLVVCVPVLAVVWLSHWLGPRLRAWRRTSREATAAVTGFVGDTFGAITAVKAAGAEDAVLRRFDALGAVRAKAARRDEVGTQLVQTLSGATGNLGLGLALLLVAPAIRRGDFSIGDLGLFTTYISVLAALPRWVGRLAAYHRQADVSVARLAELVPDRRPASYTAPVAMHLRHGPGELEFHTLVAPGSRRDDLRLERLDVEGLCVRFDGAGLDPVDLSLERGSFTVVTGPVGSGKSTLLRAVLGLIPADGGTVRWNGRPIEDRSAFLVPPRASYLPQVPRLFSERLADTILLGLDPDDLDEALHRACLDEDLTEMAHGLDTIVGPKGVRLSGGQIQRTAAARAFVRRPELLVVDDLSSALDVDTEAEVWDRLFAATAGAATVLVVTHRPAVIARADRVLDLGEMSAPV
jgi:ATP-binding cassette subfamily B protein